MSDQLCSNCGREIIPAATFCPYCGAEVAVGTDAKSAVALEVVGLEGLTNALSADELGELMERFTSSATEIAYKLGGNVEREDAARVTATFDDKCPPDAATRFASQVLDISKETFNPVAGAFMTGLYLRGGIDAVEEIDEAAATFRPHASPVAAARRLRNRAGEWQLLAGENIRNLLSASYDFTAVGFYQTRGGHKALKIYKFEKPSRTYDVLFAARPQPENPSLIPVADIESFLEAVWNKGPVRVMDIYGAGGTGKTTYLKKAAALARDKGYSVVAATCVPDRRFQPFAAFPLFWDAWIQRTARKDPVGVEEGLAIMGTEYPQWASLLTAALGLPTTVSDLVGDTPAPLRRRKLVEIGAAALNHAAYRKPLLIILDDVNHVDTASRAVLTAALTANEEATLGLITTSVSPADTDWLPSNRLRLQTSGVTTFDVTGLGDGAGYHAEEITRLARGRVGLAQQLSAFVQMQGDLTAFRSSDDEDLLVNVIRARCAEWTAVHRKTLAAAAQIGLPLPKRAWEVFARDYAGLDADTVGVWVDAMSGCGFLDRAWPLDGDTYAVPPFLTKPVLDAFAPSRKERVGTATTAATFLETVYPDEKATRVIVEIDADNIVTAAELAIAGARSARWLGVPEDAAAQLTAVIREDDRDDESGPKKLPRRLVADLGTTRAASFLDIGVAATALADLAGVALRPDDYLNARIEYLKGQAFARRGFYQEAGDALGEAFRLATVKKDTAFQKEAALAQVEALLAAAKGPPPISAIREIIETGGESPRLYAELARVLFSEGNVEDAAEAASKAYAFPDLSLHPYQSAVISITLAPIFMERGHPGRARLLSDNGIAIFENVGDKDNLARAHVVAAAVAAETSPVPDGEASWEAAVSLSRNAEYPLSLAPALLGIAKQYVLGNKIAAARACEEMASEEAERAGVALPEHGAFKSFFAFYVENDYDRAWSEAASAREGFRQRRDFPAFFRSSLRLIGVAAATGDVGTAYRELEDGALTQYAREGNAFFCRYACAAGAALAAGGDAERATRYFRSGASLAREIGIWQCLAACWLGISELEQENAKRQECFHRALRIYRNYGSPFLEARAQKGIAK